MVLVWRLLSSLSITVLISRQANQEPLGQRNKSLLATLYQLRRMGNFLPTHEIFGRNNNSSYYLYQSSLSTSIASSFSLCFFLLMKENILKKYSYASSNVLCSKFYYCYALCSLILKLLLYREIPNSSLCL